MKITQHILIFLVRIYQATLSPALAVFFGPSGRCRYTPSCSTYAREAIRIHGALMGGYLAIKRLCRCHPWANSGEDPVPPSGGKFKILNSRCLRLAPVMDRKSLIILIGSVLLLLGLSNLVNHIFPPVPVPKSMLTATNQVAGATNNSAAVSNF